MPDNSKMLAFVATCTEPDKLKSLIRNAQERGATDIEDAAFRRLVSILPSEQPGTVAYDLWRTIYAFEHILSQERNRTTLLSRTRQKITRVGETQTLVDWALDQGETKGFTMLLERRMPELTGEAIVLRHADDFEPHVVNAARARLVAHGVDVAALPRDI
jgi:hypothetical protein